MIHVITTNATKGKVLIESGRARRDSSFIVEGLTPQLQPLA
jgi:hypothetical protein